MFEAIDRQTEAGKHRLEKILGRPFTDTKLIDQLLGPKGDVVNGSAATRRLRLVGGRHCPLDRPRDGVPADHSAVDRSELRHRRFPDRQGHRCQRPSRRLLGASGPGIGIPTASDGDQRSCDGKAFLADARSQGHAERSKSLAIRDATGGSCPNRARPRLRHPENGPSDGVFLRGAVAWSRGRRTQDSAASYDSDRGVTDVDCRDSRSRVRRRTPAPSSNDSSTDRPPPGCSRHRTGSHPRTHLREFSLGRSAIDANRSRRGNNSDGKARATVGMSVAAPAIVLGYVHVLHHQARDRVRVKLPREDPEEPNLPTAGHVESVTGFVVRFSFSARPWPPTF